MVDEQSIWHSFKEENRVLLSAYSKDYDQVAREGAEHARLQSNRNGDFALFQKAWRYVTRAFVDTQKVLTLNYIRHEMTSYDSFLKRHPFADEPFAYIAWKEVGEVILEFYPELNDVYLQGLKIKHEYTMSKTNLQEYVLKFPHASDTIVYMEALSLANKYNESGKG